MAVDPATIQLLLEETTAEEAGRATAVPPLEPGEATRLPPKVTLDGMSSVKNQGQGPYCGSFSTVALMEFKFSGKDLAECSLIRNANQSTGGLMDYAMKRGVCQERQWPYDLANAARKPCADRGGGSSFCFDKTWLLYREARAAVRAGPKSDPVRMHLATNKTPVTVEVPALFDDFIVCGWAFEGGDVIYPRTLDRAKALAYATQKKRWHAVAIYGYDDSASRFLFKNSWGETWGHGGHGTMSYLYLDQLSTIGMAGG